MDMVNKVVRFMCNHGISVGDVIRAFTQLPPQAQFDLAIKQDGKIARVPFSEENKKLNPVGIYPFKDDDRYLELSESEGISSNKKIKKYLPTTEDFRRFGSIYYELNDALKELNATPLRGTYLAIMCFGAVKRFYPACYINMSGSGNPTFHYSYDGSGRCLFRYYITAEMKT